MQMLLIDESSLVRAVMRRALRSCWPDATVLEASSSDQALKLIQITPPDFVLLDLEMPGLGGTDFLGRLRALDRGQSLPVLVLSAFLEPAYRAAISLDPWVAFLEKPVAIGQIRETISRLLNLGSL